MVYRVDFRFFIKSRRVLFPQGIVSGTFNKCLCPMRCLNSNCFIIITHVGSPIVSIFARLSISRNNPLLGFSNIMPCLMQTSGASFIDGKLLPYMPKAKSLMSTFFIKDPTGISFSDIYSVIKWNELQLKPTSGAFVFLKNVFLFNVLK